MKKHKQLFSRELKKKMHKARMSHIKLLLEEIKLIKLCVMGMYKMGYPRNDEQHKQLESYIKAYDRTLKELEDDVVSRARDMIKGE